MTHRKNNDQVSTRKKKKKVVKDEVNVSVNVTERKALDSLCLEGNLERLKDEP